MGTIQDKSEPTDSKTRIIEAAIAVFARKGKHGARIDDIAAESGLNKAMIYYYYTNRNILYQFVLNKIIRNVYRYIITNVEDVVKKDIDPKLKLSKFIRSHFDAFALNPDWTKIILEALSNEPETIKSAFRSVFENGNDTSRSVVFSIFDEGWKKKIFRKVDIKQMLISILGMNMIYHLAKPIGEVLLDLDVADEDAFLNDRIESIVDLTLYGLVRQ